MTIVSGVPSMSTSDGKKNTTRYELKCRLGHTWTKVIDEDSGAVLWEQVFGGFG